MNSFQWEENSCYMDSVLWVLFRKPCLFIKTHFLLTSPRAHTRGERPDLKERFHLEMRSYLKSLTSLFRKPDSFSFSNREFRLLYQKWYENPLCTDLQQWPRFHSGETNEAQEFLQFIFSTRGMNGTSSYGMVVSETIYYGPPWTKIKKRSDTRASLIWNLPLEKTVHNVLLRTDINEVIHTHKSKTFSEMKTVLEIETLADFLVISVERFTGYEVSNDPCLVPFSIQDKKGKTLYLSGVIVFFGQNDGHYTAFSRKGKKWLYYDDLCLPVRECQETPVELFQKNGVLFFFHK